MKNRVTIPVPLTHVPLATCIAVTCNRKRSFRHTYILVTTQANELWLGREFFTHGLSNVTTQGQLAFDNIVIGLFFDKGGLSRAIK